tara:strand:+ start:19 stop:174 length:156 start_codon:yes stop_codon:yes gene_type:complete
MNPNDYKEGMKQGRLIEVDMQILNAEHELKRLKSLKAELEEDIRLLKEVEL